jgi:hypothetical protein
MVPGQGGWNVGRDWALVNIVWRFAVGELYL